MCIYLRVCAFSSRIAAAPLLNGTYNKIKITNRELARKVKVVSLPTTYRANLPAADLSLRWGLRGTAVQLWRSSAYC